MSAVFQKQTRGAGEDIPLVFDPPDNTTEISGATLALRLRNVADSTDVARSDGGSPTAGFSAPTVDGDQRILGRIPHSFTATAGGKTYRVEIWRTDGDNRGRLIHGDLLIEDSIQ